MELLPNNRGLELADLNERVEPHLEVNLQRHGDADPVFRGPLC